jgi:hypothetical protein
MRVTTVLLMAAPLLAGSGCKPQLGSPPSLINGPRLIAVRGQPAEAAPDTPVTYEALGVDVTGRLQPPHVWWAVCHEPKPPAEANAVATACLHIPDDAGPTPTFMVPMPSAACKQFGPQAPDVPPGKPPLRPRDPDITGGFYQPVRAFLTEGDVDEIAFALERLRCPLANASPEATSDFNKNYKLNTNPAIALVTLDPDGAATKLFEMGQPAPTPPTVPAGAPITLQVTWPADPPMPADLPPVPGTFSETYPAWNLVTQVLDTHRESMSVAWFATDGSFEHDRTGRGESEPETFTRNAWTAPTTAGTVHLWVVLRDSRGGIDFAEMQVSVTP